ncbi:hypothetical protein DFH29DRAFT_895264, partial [Suillus ampliporus]
DDPPSSQGPPRHRKFRTSYQTPFAANMIWESFTCDESFDGPQIRLVLNDGISLADLSRRPAIRHLLTGCIHTSQSI